MPPIVLKPMFCAPSEYSAIWSYDKNTHETKLVVYWESYHQIDKQSASTLKRTNGS